MTPSARPDPYEAIRRLLHIETAEAGTSLADLIASALAQHALVFLPAGEAHSLDAISQAIRDLFSIHLEPAELRHAIRFTIRRKPGQLVCTDPRASLYQLTDERRRALEQEAERLSSLEHHVFESWQAQLSRDYPYLEADELGALLDDQKVFNRHVLLRYGAQTQSVLCAEANPAQAMAPRMESVFDALPSRDPHMTGIRDQVVVAFWYDPDPDRARYLSSLLDNACIIHTLHIDPKCSALVRGVFAGTRFFLDTNVVYRLLNLQGPSRFFQIEALADVLRKVGAELVVSQQTLGELRASLKANEQRIRLHPIASPRLAQLAADATYESDFVSLYFAQYARTQISVADFAARVRNIDYLLGQLGVAVDSASHEDILRAAELEPEKGELLLAAPNQILPDRILTHDAFHAVLVSQLRAGTESFARAKAWFLTCDGKLRRYDRIRRRRDGTSLPFCIYPDHCMQMTRWALPRTEDYDRAFVELVASPYVTAMAQMADLPSDAAHLICARIDQYRTERNISEDLATQAAVLTLIDRRLQEGFESAATDDQRVAQIDQAIGRALEQLERKTADAEKAKALAERAAARLGVEQTSMKDELRRRDQALAAEREGRTAAEGALEKADSEKTKLTHALSETEQREQSEKKRADRAEDRLRRLSVALKWAACGAVWIVLLALFFVIQWPDRPSWGKSIYVFLASLACGLAVTLPLGFKRATIVVLTVATIGGFLLACLQHPW